MSTLTPQTESAKEESHVTAQCHHSEVWCCGVARLWPSRHPHPSAGGLVRVMDSDFSSVFNQVWPVPFGRVLDFALGVLNV